MHVLSCYLFSVMLTFFTMQISAETNRPCIFIAGDSTAAPSGSYEHMGWGEPFADYFNPQKVDFRNMARGGKSSRTFITEGFWNQILEDLQPGDIVLIQFGHNDLGAINDDNRARGTLPGLGDESEDIQNRLTGRPETVHTYGWYIRKMINDVKQRQARPILLSLTVRNIWGNGRLERRAGKYGSWMYQLAKVADVPFLDLTNRIADRFEELGRKAVEAMYPQDHTHFNAECAEMHASAVLSLLKGLKPNLLAGMFSVKGENVEADVWSWLNLPIPADPELPSLYLIGDSTLRNGRGYGQGGQWGWGDFLEPLIDTSKLNIVNRAVGGMSSRTFQTYGFWDRVLGMLQPGDFVLMQFGHNDSSPLNDRERARGTLPGIGNKSELINNMLTGKQERVFTYGWYLRKFISDARQRGATPLVCSPVPRKRWLDGEIVCDEPGYPTWGQQVAKEEAAAFIDLNACIAARYNAMGEQAVEPLFADKDTHTSAEGAKLNAECAAEILHSIPGIF